MSNYTYCRQCDSGLDEPTLCEVLTDNWQCPEGHKNAMDEQQKEDGIGNFLATFKELQNRVTELEKRDIK